MASAPDFTPTQSLEHCVLNRHSVRLYKQDPVPEETLRSCIRLAQQAPSNSNIQNWRLHLASGAARNRITVALREAADKSESVIPPLPETFHKFRSAFGHLLYGPEGWNIPREEKQRTEAARSRNYDFFGAPVCGVITMSKDLTPMDAMSVGTFVQTFLLALVQKGLGSCLQVSVTGYMEVLRREFGVPEEEVVLCGIAIGWPAEHQVNWMTVPREDVDECVRFLNA